MFFNVCAKGIQIKRKQRKAKAKKPRPLTNKERQAFALAHWKKHHGHEAVITTQEALKTAFSSSSDDTCDSAVFSTSNEANFIPKNHNIDNLLDRSARRARMFLSPSAPEFNPIPAPTPRALLSPEAPAFEPELTEGTTPIPTHRVLLLSPDAPAFNPAPTKATTPTPTPSRDNHSSSYMIAATDALGVVFSSSSSDENNCVSALTNNLIDETDLAPKRHTGKACTPLRNSRHDPAVFSPKMQIKDTHTSHTPPPPPIIHGHYHPVHTNPHEYENPLNFVNTLSPISHPNPNISLHNMNETINNPNINISHNNNIFHFISTFE